jgi:hypothetical protein
MAKEEKKRDEKQDAHLEVGGIVDRKGRGDHRVHPLASKWRRAWGRRRQSLKRRFREKYPHKAEKSSAVSAVALSYLRKKYNKSDGATQLLALK